MSPFFGFPSTAFIAFTLLLFQHLQKKSDVFDLSRLVFLLTHSAHRDFK